MKIDILSDLHLDFWVKPNNNTKTKRLIQVLDDLLDSSEDTEVLIVAGDISHYPIQLELLDKIAEIYNYKKIFCVLGNHDLYLVSNTQRNTYKDSIQKQQDYYSYKSDVVTILDGDIVEYKGIKFGGAMGWYDGSYMNRSSLSREDNVGLWKRIMNDSVYIKGYKDFYEIFEIEEPKIKNILSADIVITHVCPLSHSSAFQERYRYELSNMFYAFNGERYLEETKAKFWVYGHSHGSYSFNAHDTFCVMNTLGYPSEKDRQKMTIEI